MRVLGLELCHYTDELITCTATAAPQAAAALSQPPHPTTAHAPVASSMQGRQYSLQSDAASVGPPAQKGSDGQNCAGESGTNTEVGVTFIVNALVDTPIRVSLTIRSKQSGTEAGQSEQPPNAVAHSVARSYSSIVEFVLELLSDAAEGAKVAETAVPLQLHLRCLQIIHWQAVSDPLATPAGAQRATGDCVSSVLADGVQKLLASEGSFARLRCALVLGISIVMLQLFPR